MTETKSTRADYIPQHNYAATNYVATGPRKEHFCIACKAYYKKLYEAGVTTEPFPIRCDGDVRTTLPSKENLGVDADTYEEMKVLNDPVAWAKMMFNWKARWYQCEVLRCTARWAAIRAGRRSGKTLAIAIKALHHAWTHQTAEILVVAPYQSQVAKIFREMEKFINMSPEMSMSTNTVKSPQMTIRFTNGSQIIGFSSGKNKSQHGDQIRGQDANLILLDEVDLMNDYDIDTISAILLSHPDVGIVASSTPKGWRRKFYNYCVDKNLRFKEFHYISAEAPNWTTDSDEFFKKNMSRINYEHEILAEFGEAEAGVFNPSAISDSLFDYDLNELSPTVGARRIMGVDWNLRYGTHIVILEHLNGKFVLVHKTVVPKGEFTQHFGVEKIVELNKIWDPQFIYVDQGFGDTQIEMLKITGLNMPASGLAEKVKPVMMGKTIDIVDQETGATIKKGTKQFAVEIAVHHMDERRCVLPYSEDTQAILEPDQENPNIGLVQQMRAFAIEKLSSSGQPIYSKDNDHTLTAWVVAILGFQLEWGGLKEAPTSCEVAELSVSEEEINSMPNRSGGTQAILARGIPNRILDRKPEDVWEGDFILTSKSGFASIANTKEVRRRLSGIDKKPQNPRSIGKPVKRTW